MGNISDLVVVGSGVTGLYAALCAADQARVLLLTKRSLCSSNSYLAQGGVAAALGSDDSELLHSADTVAVGRGLCHQSAVQVLVNEAPARIAALLDLGVEFDEAPAREGGHSRRRVMHAGGLETGKQIAEALADRAREHPRITLAQGEPARALVRAGNRCVGVVTDRRTVRARAVLLATGGYAALWERTTNPPSALGEGVLMAYQAGAAVADLEFVQFHPTALVGNGLLLSEALRGDGAVLLDEAGERFIDELAPRDVVSRAIAARNGAQLDLRGVARDRYPTVMATLERAGYDPSAELIPVSPAAHYSIGGIVTDLDGRSSLPGLYAAGECACTGVHGANRLASNSLLECLVFGRRAALAALGEPEPSTLAPPLAAVAEAPFPPELRQTLWDDVGLVRSAGGLERLLAAPRLIVRLIAQGALIRRESRGVHFRADHPSEDERFAGHIVHRLGVEPVLQQWD